MKRDSATNAEGLVGHRLLWAACLVAALGLTLGVFFFSNSIPPNEQVAQPRVAHRIPEHGRLSLALADLPSTGAIPLELMLTESPDARDTRSARIVSAEGKRLDVLARRVAGTSSVIQLEIDRNFLSKGLYLIQIEAEDDHPLHLRRYVLELR